MCIVYAHISDGIPLKQMDVFEKLAFQVKHKGKVVRQRVCVKVYIMINKGYISATLTM